jgi:hypothetical protein
VQLTTKREDMINAEQGVVIMRPLKDVFAQPGANCPGTAAHEASRNGEAGTAGRTAPGARSHTTAKPYDAAPAASQPFAVTKPIRSGANPNRSTASW